MQDRQNTCSQWTAIEQSDPYCVNWYFAAELWEGGVRGAAFVSGWGISKTDYRNTGLLHATDWFPTFAYLAGVNISHLPLDGMNIWNAISQGQPSPRTEILHNIDPITNYSAIRMGEYKLLTGMGPGQWYPPANISVDWEMTDNTDQKIYLFDVITDPSERNNLVTEKPEIVQKMQERLEYYATSSVPCRYPDPDPKANPNLRSGVWEPWQ